MADVVGLHLSVPVLQRTHEPFWNGAGKKTLCTGKKTLCEGNPYKIACKPRLGADREVIMIYDNFFDINFAFLILTLAYWLARKGYRATPDLIMIIAWIIAFFDTSITRSIIDMLQEAR